MMEAGMIDFEPLIPPNHIADVMSCKGYACATDLFTAFTMTYRGFVDICFLGVGQIDKYGNLNTTSIGDYYQPDLRLPGSGGAADFISYAKANPGKVTIGSATPTRVSRHWPRCRLPSPIL